MHERMQITAYIGTTSGPTRPALPRSHLAHGATVLARSIRSLPKPQSTPTNGVRDNDKMKSERRHVASVQARDGASVQAPHQTHDRHVSKDDLVMTCVQSLQPEHLQTSSAVSLSLAE